MKKVIMKVFFLTIFVTVVCFAAIAALRPNARDSYDNPAALPSSPTKETPPPSPPERLTLSNKEATSLITLAAMTITQTMALRRSEA